MFSYRLRPLLGLAVAGRRKSWAALIALWMLAATAGLQEAGAQDRTRFLKWSYQDAGALVVDAGTRAPLIAGSAGVLVAASELDPVLLEDVQSSNAEPVSSFLDVTNQLGDANVPLLAAGVFGVSLATDDARFQDAAFTSLQSLVYARLITNSLKGIVGRSRPEAQAGVHRFAPFSGRTSFPSGHTTTAFALVTPWVLYYPHPVTYGLFALSAGTAVARMAKDRHWPTDVVAGAAIGFLTARYLTHRHQDKETGIELLSILPAYDARAVGVSLRLRIH